MAITNVGKAIAARRLYGTADAVTWANGQGTGTTAAAAADTVLETEKKADGTAASGVHCIPTGSVTFSNVTTTVTNDTMQAVGTVAETATMAITESGLLNADTNGSLLCRQVF